MEDEPLANKNPAPERSMTRQTSGGKSIPEGVNNSIFMKIALNDKFQNFTLVVIVVYALWIGIEVQNNHPNLERESTEPWPVAATIIENVFCTFFFFEIMMRFLMYKRKIDFFKDNWNRFDGLLVLFMVIETWILAILTALIGGGEDGLLSKFAVLRLLRLLRLTRMARIMKQIPELLTLVKGMISATRSVGFIVIFLVICMYMFAIVFVAHFGDFDAPERSYPVYYWQHPDEPQPTAVELFGSMGDAMISLFTRGMLCDNLAETLVAIRDHGGEIRCSYKKHLVDYNGKGSYEIEMVPLGDIDDDTLFAVNKEWKALGLTASADYCERGPGGKDAGAYPEVMYMWIFIIFVIISAFCLLNMLIGVLCEVITASAEEENEKRSMFDLRKHLEDAFIAIDSSQDGSITSLEWEQMKNDRSVRASMANLGVEEQYMDERLQQMQESLFPGEDFQEESKEMGFTMTADGKKKRAATYSGAALDFESFMDKVQEIRPDTPASALDIEMLRVRIEREEKSMNTRIDVIEEALAKATATTTLSSTAEVDPVVKTSDWLRSVPTDVLHAVLDRRAGPGKQASVGGKVDAALNNITEPIS